MITLDTILSDLHSIEIKDASGQALAIDGSGYLTANINGSVTVSASDLDIRDLTSVSDSVAAVQSGAWTVAATQSGTWNIGTVASITADVTVTASDLDIRDLAFASDSVTAHQGGSWSMTIDNISSWKNTASSVTNTAAEIVATPLANRVKMLIQNLGANDVYAGPDNAVTSSNGMKIPKGSSMEMNFDTGSDIWLITSAGTANIRVSEYAA